MRHSKNLQEQSERESQSWIYKISLKRCRQIRTQKQIVIKANINKEINVKEEVNIN
jgi:hypothetical protein